MATENVERHADEIVFNGTTYRVAFGNLLPPLTDDEIRELRNDIKHRGVIYPIVVTDQNEVIDGANRLHIAAELGLAEVPFTEKTGLTPEEQRQLALDLNVHRRQLSRAAKKRLIKEHLRANPTQSNKAIAMKLQVDDKTVAKNRAELEANSEIPNSQERKGRDGHKRPAHPKRAPREKESTSQPNTRPVEANEQPSLFVIDKPQKEETQANNPVKGGQPNWAERLREPSSRVEASSKELKRLRKLKAADQSPKLVHEVADHLRQIAEFLDKSAFDFAAEQSSPALHREAAA
jgi:ParB-like chromosome segregation protein Spo0J